MTSSSKKPNRLLQSTSPYLLQHAYNPVDWYEWGTEALAKAKSENKSILVSIGYSSCHWCHVMERESFEVDEIAELMNEHFVCIKVDREERPDIDQIYMEAVQAMGINGGWPLNVFLTPDQKPFYGGTYFPPKNWAQLLIQINKAFTQKQNEITSSANDLAEHLRVSDLQRLGHKVISEFGLSDLHNMFTTLESKFDKIWGGIEKAPKFVMPAIWQFLLRYVSITQNKEALHMVTLTLNKMSQGGIYDQIGGGFSRYSVDSEWFAPHFEKMLYDNAQLVSLYAEAFAVSNSAVFKRIITETVEWLTREMKHPEGGFYSALDADSEGIEGKFYSWTYQELKEALGEETEAIAKYYHATPEGNWEHARNILFREELTHSDFEIFAASKKKHLLAVRNTRVRPGLDDKILTGWNAMMIKALTDAYNYLGDIQYLNLALANISFIEKYLVYEGQLYRAHKNKRSDTLGFLEDYAFVIQGYLALYQATFNEEFIRQADYWCSYALNHFYDEEEGFFYFTDSGAEKLIARKKEVFDNVIPSSNSVMARNLFQLGVILDRGDLKSKAQVMVSKLSQVIKSEPGYCSNWGIALAEQVNGLVEVVIVGPKALERRAELARHYLPFVLVMGSLSKSDLPLFKGRDSIRSETKIYVCQNKVCKLPVESVRDALSQIKTNS